MRLLGLVKIALLIAVAGFAAILLYGYARTHPQDLPWTALDLAQPIGLFTGRKLVALGDAPGQCQGLLTRAGVRFEALPRRISGQCGYEGAVRFERGGALSLGYAPAGLATSCPVAAALALWEWHVVQPAAIAHLGRQVARVEHYGSYSCRRVYGRAEGRWSEHAAANAVDVAGFMLSDGARIGVLRDWDGDDPEARFLRAVRDGACDLFATVLSPDYNAAHRDHLHFDQAARGAMGWRGCN